MIPIQSGGVGAEAPASLKKPKNNNNPFPGRTAISDILPARIGRPLIIRMARTKIRENYAEI